ncbi:sodium/hydrogen exchanger 1 isoform X2 [Selaginella moellendorffii]|uniref:sodium/hydrogen exchanger 1 isoform X2 n=1 Tax=Selaginella moellendorffii TaxID=88036 RepID=UPI000D1C2606|nr:sodium/hydrogen exchanger 1 isoform X2 [Selaginella moellendorffii]|eukprot:XP_024526136.1 sodium/hydrogen exchanger 1 isoform X2 [Selaginella moellendorffii]
MADYVGPLHSWLIKNGLGESVNHTLVVSISLFVTLICACIVLGHLLEEVKWASESIVSLILGVGTGFIVLIISGGKNSHILQFNEELFFIYLLPPIIFNAGFQVKKKHFFRNFASIMLYGAAGVFISFVIISFGCRYIFPHLGLNLAPRSYLALGTIFSATDTVCTLQVLSQDETPLLYSLVFGEGVVNDATSVVLFRTIQKLGTASINGLTALGMFADFIYLFLSSTVLGVAAGLLSAYIIKTLYFGRHSTDREIAIMTLMAYLSYMIAELFYLSGILTVFFCGIVMSHYTWHNVTESSRITTKYSDKSVSYVLTYSCRHTFATMSFIAETFIFLYVGMDALDLEKWRLADKRQSFSIFGVVIALVLVSRAAFVFPLSAVANFFTRSEAGKITIRQQVIIWWAGLIRGAVSIALAFNEFTRSGSTIFPDNATLITSTIIAVLFSTVVFGMITKPLIGWLLPPHMRRPAVDSEPSSPKEANIDHTVDGNLELPLLTERLQNLRNGVARRSSLRMLLEAPTSTIHRMWRSFDDAYMRPMFGGRGFVPILPGSPGSSKTLTLAGSS